MVECPGMEAVVETVVAAMMVVTEAAVVVAAVEQSRTATALLPLKKYLLVNLKYII